jgi:small subunit ribosomal protein S20
VANTKSAIKRIRSSERKRQRNRMVRSAARTEVKKARKLMESGHLEEAAESTQRALKLLDKAAAKGVIHKRNASRRKSRLMLALNGAMDSSA